MQHSAGIIPYKFVNGEVMFFLGHPGGPINAKRNYWALLKGTMENGENPLDTAIREFQEESGLELEDKTKENLWLVGTIKQRNDKIVTAYAVEVDYIDCDKCHSNLVKGENFPEMDRYRWFTMEQVRGVVSKTNLWFYEEILSKLGIDEDN